MKRTTEEETTSVSKRLKFDINEIQNMNEDLLKENIELQTQLTTITEAYINLKGRKEPDFIAGSNTVADMPVKKRNREALFILCVGEDSFIPIKRIQNDAYKYQQQLLECMENSSKLIGLTSHPNARYNVRYVLSELLKSRKIERVNIKGTDDKFRRGYKLRNGYTFAELEGCIRQKNEGREFENSSNDNIIPGNMDNSGNSDN